MAKIVNVISGDTFETDSKEKFCLVGVNAPQKPEEGWKVATDQLRLLVQNKYVWVFPGASHERFVYLGEKSVNEMMRTFVKALKKKKVLKK